MSQLASEIHLAFIGDHAVVLDLARDKYLALPQALARAAARLIAGDPPTEPELASARAALIRQGILVDAPAVAGASTQAPIAADALWPTIDSGQRERSPRLVGILAVQLALSATWLSLRLRPFRKTVSWVGAHRVGRRPVSRQDLLNEYAIARAWFPARLVCRLDAMALCLHLRRGGCPARLVFGVRLDPFLAHCWVQCDDLVLNEPADIVRRYTPILTV